MKKENILLVLVIIYCCIIFALSSIPGSELQGITTPDYIMHGLEYAGLGYLLCWWMIETGEKPVTALLRAVVLASVYGISDEFHQYFVPGRCTSVSDWIADTLGSLAGAGILLQIRFWFKRT